MKATIKCQLNIIPSGCKYLLTQISIELISKSVGLGDKEIAKQIKSEREEDT